MPDADAGHNVIRTVGLSLEPVYVLRICDIPAAGSLERLASFRAKATYATLQHHASISKSLWQYARKEIPHVLEHSASVRGTL